MPYTTTCHTLLAYTTGIKPSREAVYQLTQFTVSQNVKTPVKLYTVAGGIDI